MLGVVQERAAALFCEEWMEGRGLGQVCSGVSRTWLPLLCEVAPLNKEPEESQKEQAVSQQLRENGATPTGGQARRRNGPASMAASYLNIAQLLGKARGEAQWRRRAGLRSPKPVCNSKEMLFLPQTGCVAAQHWDSVICQWNPAAGGASSKSCLPLVWWGLHSVGNYPNVWTEVTPSCCSQHLSSSPCPLSPKPWKQEEMANVMCELAPQTWQGAVTIRGFCRLRLSILV